MIRITIKGVYMKKISLLCSLLAISAVANAASQKEKTDEPLMMIIRVSEAETLNIAFGNGMSNFLKDVIKKTSLEGLKAKRPKFVLAAINSNNAKIPLTLTPSMLVHPADTKTPSEYTSKKCKDDSGFDYKEFFKRKR